MKKNLSLIVVIFISIVSTIAFADQNLINTSRSNCVQIIVPSLNSQGSGFFIDPQHVLTCFHVVGKFDYIPKTSEYKITTGKDVFVITAGGEKIDADVITTWPKSFSKFLTPRVYNEAFPVLCDFAILKLKTKSKSQITIAPLFRGKDLPPIGSNVIFSGYPLDAPTMLTHRGMISGIAHNQLICVEASVNKGNSGGALLDDKGEIIGIIDMREGGISKGLDDLRKYIDRTKKYGSVELMGVDPLAADKAMIDTLDTYISTGIGYARTIKNVTDYLDKNPNLLK